MKVVPIATFLSEFDADNSNELIEQQPEQPFVPPVVDDRTRISSAELNEKYQTGFSDGQKQAKAEYEGQLEAMKTRLSDQYQQELTDLYGKLSGELSNKLNADICKIEATLENTLAEVVKPFVSERVKVKIIDELKKAILDLLDDCNSCKLIVHGPKDTLKMLGHGLEDLPIAVEYVENDELNVNVAIAKARVETRFQLWSTLLEKETG